MTEHCTTCHREVESEEVRDTGECYECGEKEEDEN